MKPFALLSLLFCLAFTLQAQIRVDYPDGKKSTYQTGEVIHVHLLLKSTPETCLDGMKQSKIFPSGLKINSQTPWKQVAKAQFQKELYLEVVSNKKKSAKLTILRKVDKENLFHQETFTILTN